MSIYNLLYFNHPNLFFKTKDVTLHDNKKIEKIIEKMFNTLYSIENAIGLAANQIGLKLAITVIDISKKRNDPIYLINPKIKKKKGILIEEEGCLSLPSVRSKVKRSKFIEVEAKDKNGKISKKKYEGLLSRVIQHETDHLNGLLYTNRLSYLKRSRIHLKVKKYLKKNKIK